MSVNEKICWGIYFNYLLSFIQTWKPCELHWRKCYHSCMEYRQILYDCRFYNLQLSEYSFLSVLRFYSDAWLVDNSPRSRPVLLHTLCGIFVGQSGTGIICSVVLSVVIALALHIYRSFGVSHWAHYRPQFQWSTVALPDEIMQSIA
jgi:hypothetical protein